MGTPGHQNFLLTVIDGTTIILTNTTAHVQHYLSDILVVRYDIPLGSNDQVLPCCDWTEFPMGQKRIQSLNLFRNNVCRSR